MADISKINVNNTTYNIKDARLPNLNSSTSQYLRGDGTWAAPTVETMSGNVDVSDEDTYLLIEPGSGGGGVTVQTATGTFTGNGTRTVDISCVFEPDIVYWTSDPGTTASSGTVGGIIVREMMSANRYRNNSTTNSHYAVLDITAMNTDGSSYSFRATYTNSTVTLYCFSSNARSLFTSGRTYTYKFIKWTT